VTHRGQSAPREALKVLIELVNLEELFDPSTTLPNSYHPQSDPSVRIYAIDWHRERSLQLEHHRKIADTVKPPTREYLGPVEDMAFQARYRTLLYAGDLLRAIARNQYKSAERLEPLMQADQLPFSIITDLVLDENNKIVLGDNVLLRALLGVPADRIRSCAICRHIFWAARVNSDCCTERCRKTYNQRNSRQSRRELISKRNTKKGR